MITIYCDKIIGEEEFFSGFLHVEEGQIAKITRNLDRSPDYDYTGYYLMPGLVNIHSEYIARETQLATNKFFPFAKIFRDVEIKFLSAGVTTLFHSLELVRGRYRNDFASGPQMVKSIRELSRKDSLIDHKTHMEFPLSFIDSIDKIKELIEGNYLDYISYLGYLRNEEERYREVYYQEYIQRVMSLDENTVTKMVERVRELRSESNLEELAYMVKYANYKGVKVGSAELDSIKKLGFLQKNGINIIEFPINQETVDFAKEHGKKILVDCLSLLKKQRNSGGVDLLKAVTEGKVDILSSDTRSGDLLPTIFCLGKTIGLPKAVALSTSNAAEAVGLVDRGKIKVGKKADLLVVKEMAEQIPLVKAVFCEGRLQYDITL